MIWNFEGLGVRDLTISTCVALGPTTKTFPPFLKTTGLLSRASARASHCRHSLGFGAAAVSQEHMRLITQT